MCLRMHRNAFRFLDPLTAKGTATEAARKSKPRIHGVYDKEGTSAKAIDRKKIKIF